MNNGLTSVFVSVLTLAASELAETDRQRECAAWFASHDQSVFGLGTVGFDMSELPWSLDAFASDRGFVLRVIHAAKARVGWERLGYEPHEEWVQHCLDQFRAMVEAFAIEYAAGSEAAVWPCGRPKRLVLCPVHRVYQHEQGCVLCSDQ
jgi:hypothetical protein